MVVPAHLQGLAGARVGALVQPFVGVRQIALALRPAHVDLHQVGGAEHLGHARNQVNRVFGLRAGGQFLDGLERRDVVLRERQAPVPGGVFAVVRACGGAVHAAREVVSLFGVRCTQRPSALRQISGDRCICRAAIVAHGGDGGVVVRRRRARDAVGDQRARHRPLVAQRHQGAERGGPHADAVGAGLAVQVIQHFEGHIAAIGRGFGVG